MGLAQIYAMFYFFINIKLILRNNSKFKNIYGEGQFPSLIRISLIQKRPSKVLLTKF